MNFFKLFFSVFFIMFFVLSSKAAQLALQDGALLNAPADTGGSDFSNNTGNGIYMTGTGIATLNIHTNLSANKNTMNGISASAGAGITINSMGGSKIDFFNNRNTAVLATGAGSSIQIKELDLTVNNYEILTSTGPGFREGLRAEAQGKVDVIGKANGSNVMHFESIKRALICNGSNNKSFLNITNYDINIVDPLGTVGVYSGGEMKIIGSNVKTNKLTIINAQDDAISVGSSDVTQYRAFLNITDMDILISGADSSALWTSTNGETRITGRNGQNNKLELYDNNIAGFESSDNSDVYITNMDVLSKGNYSFAFISQNARMTFTNSKIKVLANEKGFIFMNETVLLTLDNTTFNTLGNFVEADNGGLDAVATVILNNSFAEGAALLTAGSISLELNDNSTWNMNADSALTNLKLDNSSVYLGSSAAGIYNTLTVDNIDSLNNGTIKMNTALGDDTSQSDLLIINTGLNGQLTLDINGQPGNNMPTTDDGIMLVNASATGGLSDNSIVLKGGVVDNGAYEYSLFKGDIALLNPDNFYLRTTRSITNIFNSMINAAEVMAGISQTGMNSLNLRLGDMRRTPQDKHSAIWTRVYGKTLKIDRDIETNYDIFGFEAGYDLRVKKSSNDRYYVGIMGGYQEIRNIKTPQTNAKTGTGSGTAPSIGVYGTWFSENGYFADIVLRNFWASLDMTNYMANGTEISYKPERAVTNISLEFGKEFNKELSEKSKLALEPKVIVGYGYGASNTSKTNAGDSLKYGSTDYVNARAAALLGYIKILSGGTIIEPYAEAGYRHEFAGKTDITYTQVTTESDISGGTFDISAGFNTHFTNSISVYSNISYEQGSSNTFIGANAGIRYAFGGESKKTENDNSAAKEEAVK